MHVRKTSVAFLAATLGALFLMASPQANAQAAKKTIVGRWTISVAVSDGSNETATLNFTKNSEGAITGTVETEHGTVDISKGTSTGATFSIEFTLNIDNSAMAVNMSGSFEGDTIKGEGSAGDVTFKFTGSRKTAAN